MSNKLGDFLKATRKERGYTFFEVVKLTGLTKEHLSALEKGAEEEPTDRVLQILGSVYRIPTEHLKELNNGTN